MLSCFSVFWSISILRLYKKNVCVYMHISISNLYLYPPTPPSFGILFLQITFLTFLGVIILPTPKNCTLTRKSLNVFFNTFKQCVIHPQNGLHSMTPNIPNMIPVVPFSFFPWMFPWSFSCFFCPNMRCKFIYESIPIKWGLNNIRKYQEYQLIATLPPIAPWFSENYVPQW